MKWIASVTCLFVSIWLSNLSAQHTAYVFLHDECLISQHYTLLLNELEEAYGADSLKIIGVFPNQRTTELDLAVFKDKYQINFELARDTGQRLTKAFKVKVTPEVVVYDEQQQSILYQGRIDDTYFRVGKKRRVTTSHELADVLSALAEGRAVTTAGTDAVGCLIQLE